MQRTLHGTALVALDKLDKIGPDGVAQELAERGIDESGARRVPAADVPGERRRTETSDVSPGLVGDEPAGRAALDEPARRSCTLAAGTSAAARSRCDPSLARGLSYYTGAIMEINVADLAGSLGGGGRYDNLVGMFLGQNIPACGFSLGLERILVVMGERDMFPPSLATTPGRRDGGGLRRGGRARTRCALAAALRAAGLRVLVYPDADKIGKQIKYADSRGIPFVAMLGEDEIAAGTVTVKNLAAQTQAHLRPGRGGRGDSRGIETTWLSNSVN